MGNMEDFKLKISRVIARSKMSQVLQQKCLTMADKIDDRIKKQMEKLGKQAVEEIKEAISSRSGGGRNYKYVDKKGKILYEWNASSPENSPVMVYGVLRRNIEYKIKRSSKDIPILQVGVFSKEPSAMPSIAYNSKKQEIVVGPGGKRTPINIVARSLEFGVEDTENRPPMKPRPFIRPTFLRVVERAKTETRKALKEEMLKIFRVKKMNISFRIVSSLKEKQD